MNSSNKVTKEFYIDKDPLFTQ